MKTHSLLSSRPLALALAALLLALAVPGRAHAKFTLTLTQSGNNVVISGNGSLDTTALSLTAHPTNSVSIRIIPSNGYVVSGALTNNGYNAYSGLTGPKTFGSAVLTNADAGTGSVIGVNGAGSTLGLFAPQGYTSGTSFTTSSTYDNATFASLGFTPGVYTYTWGTGADADSFIVTGGVPEPAT